MLDEAVELIENMTKTMRDCQHLIRFTEDNEHRLGEAREAELDKKAEYQFVQWDAIDFLERYRRAHSTGWL